jgi:carboxymethylenebutenolidase
MNEYQRYLIEEFADEYQERRMSRRDLVRRAVLIMGSVPAGMAALAAIGCGDDENEFPEGVGTPERTPVPTTPTTATTPAPTPSAPTAGADIRTSDVRFAGPGSDLLGYLARPPGDAIFPGVLVIHENRGLNEHTRDIARRFAAEGFGALAVDLVSRKGGSTGDTAANTGALGSANPDDLVADMMAYAEHLAGLDGVKAGGIGVTGFCFGGGYTFETAIASELVKAAVPYYGICRLIDQLATTPAAVLAIYGERDTRVTSQADRVREELAKTGRPHEVKIYEGANHAFFNDTGSNYHAGAAMDAWEKTLAWFREYV